MEKNIERLIAQKKPPIKKFNNNPPKKEVPGPNTFRPDIKGKKKAANEDSADSESDTITNNFTTGNFKGQLHPNLGAAFGMNSNMATSTVQNHQNHHQVAVL